MAREIRMLARALRQHVEGLRALGLSCVPRMTQIDASARSSTDLVADNELSRKMRLAKLANEVKKCRRCPLYQTATNDVVSDGSAQAKLAFVGEAPGRDEDLQGKPFVGAAGQLLSKMITAMGMRREEVYICNVVKHRPPGNRLPLPDELEACFPFLQEQLAVVRPKVICTLGAVATKALLGSYISITKVRGTVHDYQDIAVVPTFHPAYLLRNPAAKKFAWEDLKRVKKLLEG